MHDNIHLRVFRERSELVLSNGKTEVFFEGAMDSAARQRLKKIMQSFTNGYLENRIVATKEGTTGDSLAKLTDQEIVLLDRLIGAMTSEVGRALLALTIMQLCIKAIEPQQSIRLHKGGNSSKDFS